jgi:hypothetical protein
MAWRWLALVAIVIGWTIPFSIFVEWASRKNPRIEAAMVAVGSAILRLVGRG